MIAELFLDAEELVVLGDALSAVGGAGFDLASIQSDDEVGDGGVSGLARTVGDNSGPAGVLGHLDGFDGLGEGADLIELDEDGVSSVLFNALLDDFGVGDEEVVADELNLAAEFLAELLPTFPVAFGHAVFKRDKGEFVGEFHPVTDKLIGGIDFAGFGLMINDLAIFALFALGPFRGSGVHGEHEVFARLIAGGFDAFHDEGEDFFVRTVLGVGGESTFIASSGGEALALQDLLEGVEDLGAPTESFAPRGSADWHDEEFLGVDVVIGVRTAVHDVHHRNGEGVGSDSANEAVKRETEALSSSVGGGKRDGEDGIGAKTAFVVGAVEFDHSGVDEISVAGIEADQSVGNFGVDVVDGFGDAFSAIAGFVTVAELNGLTGAGGGAGRALRTADGAIGEGNLGLNGRVAAGIDDLAAKDFDDFGIVHFHSPLRTARL